MVVKLKKIIFEEEQAGSARHLETWNTPGYLFGIFQDLENLEKWCFSLKYKITPGKHLKFAAICDHVAHNL